MSDEREGDDATAERVGTMHRELDATAELPVNREASAYLGEAAAVARDLHEREASESVVRERAGHVARLLDSIDGTGNAEANDRVAAARAAAVALSGGGDESNDGGTDGD